MIATSFISTITCGQAYLNYKDSKNYDQALQATSLKAQKTNKKIIQDNITNTSQEHQKDLAIHKIASALVQKSKLEQKPNMSQIQDYIREELSRQGIKNSGDAVNRIANNQNIIQQTGLSKKELEKMLPDMIKEHSKDSAWAPATVGVAAAAGIAMTNHDGNYESHEDRIRSSNYNTENKADSVSDTSQDDSLPTTDVTL